MNSYGLLIMQLAIKQKYSAIFAIGLLSLLTSCNYTTITTSYTSSDPPPGSFSQTYTASLTAGEIIALGVDTTTMTYTFKILLSSYYSSGKKGVGQMTSQNADGSFNLAASPDGFIQGGKIYVVQNGTLSGYITTTSSTGNFNVPVFGTSSPITSLNNLPDTFNYVSLSCPTRPGGNYQVATPGCTSDYGTIKINADNTYIRCSKQDLTTITPCSSQTSGTLSVAQSQDTSTTTLAGIFNLTPTGSATNSAWIFGYTATNGRKVAVIGFNDSRSGGYGFGQAVLVSQVTVSVSDITGEYSLFNLIDGEKTTKLQGTTYSSTTTTAVGSATGSINPNSPWTGMVSWADSGGSTNGNALITGTGVYVSQKAVASISYLLTNKWYELGIKPY